MNRKNNIHTIILCFILCISFSISSCDKEKSENQIPQDYVLSIYPTSIEVGESGMGKLTLSAEPAGALDWHVDNVPSWFVLEKESGVLSEDGIYELSYTIPDETGLERDDYFEQLTFDLDTYDRELLNISLNLDSYHYNNFLEFNFATYPLEIPVGSNTASFTVDNDNYSNIYWQLQDTIAHISIEPSNGYFLIESSTEIQIEIDKSVFTQTGRYFDTIRIETSVGTTHKIRVASEVIVDGSFWEIPYQIIDAFYYPATDEIIGVAEDPNEMVFINPNSETSSTIPLAKKPNCMHINNETGYAVVGHDAFFSYINLNTKEVEEVFSISFNALDIILAPNDMVYISKTENSPGSWFDLKCFDLESGVEYNSNSQYQNYYTTINIHPSGNYLYCRKGSYSSDIFKFDIQNDTAVYLYQSNLHYNQYLGETMWISKNGEKIFTGYTVLTSSVDEQTDLLYAGYVSEESSKMVGFDDLPERNLFCALLAREESYSNTALQKLVIYSLDYLSPMATFDYPDFLVSTNKNSKEAYIAEGRFVFINSSGSIANVMVQAEEDYPGNSPWGIIKYDIQNY